MTSPATKLRSRGVKAPCRPQKLKLCCQAKRSTAKVMNAADDFSRAAPPACSVLQALSLYGVLNKLYEGTRSGPTRVSGSSSLPPRLAVLTLVRASETPGCEVPPHAPVPPRVPPYARGSLFAPVQAAAPTRHLGERPVELRRAAGSLDGRPSRGPAPPPGLIDGAGP